jgi:general secretion pathway protein K
VQVEASERSRMQSTWLMSGAVGFSRLILRQDDASVDHLDDIWAKELAETKISTFLSTDKDNTDDAPEAFVRGQITDAQARYNLRNLVGTDGVVLPVELETLKRLCAVAGVSADVADRLAQGLRAALAAVNGAGIAASLLPQTVAQLDWLGVDPQTIQQLAPYIVLLPAATPLNLNTAAPEVIAAAFEGLDLGAAQHFVAARPFNSLAKAQSELGNGAVLTDARASVASKYFEVEGRLRLADRVLQERWLVRRENREVTPLRRDRINLNDPGS